jgi:hypothetical protein
MLKTNTATCARLLAYVTGLVNQQLLLQNEYLQMKREALAKLNRQANESGQRFDTVVKE